MRVVKIAALAAVLAGVGAVAPANAQAVTNTSLANVNGTYGAGTATTTTTASGTVTTVTGPGGDGNRAYIPVVGNTWQQSAVGGGASVGITTQYTNDGNGAAFFSSPGADGKADLTYYFSGGGVALSSLTSMSFDFYNDPSNTSVDSPVMRLLLTDNGNYAGALVSEYHYQNQTDAPTGTWVTQASTLDSGIFWATNSLLGPTNAAASGGELTLSQWLSANPGENIQVVGVSVGFGSGDAGTYSGGVDHVQFAFDGGPSNNFDFQVASAPEPAVWALMILGFGGAGAMLRRQRKTVAA